MTDEKIIEALECCVRYENHMACRGCPFNESGVCEEDGLALQKYSLDLIKRQQAEIEQWKEEANKYQNMWCATTEDIQMAKDEAVREFENKILELFPSDKDFTTISRFTIKQITKELADKGRM